MKKRISLSRRITASELRANNSECRIYTAEEIQEFRKNRMIELNRTKLLKVQETSAADSDYSSVSENAAADSDYSSVSESAATDSDYSSVSESAATDSDYSSVSKKSEK